VAQAPVETKKPPAALAGGGLCVARNADNFFGQAPVPALALLIRRTELEWMYMSTCSKSKLQQCVKQSSSLYEGQAADREHSNVVFLSKLPSRFCHIKGCLVAQVMDAIESEQFARRLAGLNNAI